MSSRKIKKFIVRFESVSPSLSRKALLAGRRPVRPPPLPVIAALITYTIGTFFYILNHTRTNVNIYIYYSYSNRPNISHGFSFFLSRTWILKLLNSVRFCGRPGVLIRDH